MYLTGGEYIFLNVLKSVYFSLLNFFVFLSVKYFVLNCYFVLLQQKLVFILFVIFMNLTLLYGIYEYDINSFDVVQFPIFKYYVYFYVYFALKKIYFCLETLFTLTLPCSVQQISVVKIWLKLLDMIYLNSQCPGNLLKLYYYCY